jgi:hypothetical protein
MNRSHFPFSFSPFQLLLAACFFSGSWVWPIYAQVPAPPPTRQDNVREVIHGVEIVDPYRWLEDQDAKETRDWVAAQNAYTHSLLDGLPMRPRTYSACCKCLIMIPKAHHIRRTATIFS